MQSKAFDKSMRTDAQNYLLSRAIFIFSIMTRRDVEY